MDYPSLSRGARFMSARLYNESGTEIGDVVEWVMDVNKGCVLFVVAEFYNTPGFYPIPWPLLKTMAEPGAFVVDQKQVQRPDLFINHHELTEMIEDLEMLEKIFSAHQIPLRRSGETIVLPIDASERNGRSIPSGEWMWIERSSPDAHVGEPVSGAG